MMILWMVVQWSLSLQNDEREPDQAVSAMFGGNTFAILQIIRFS